MPEIAGTEPLEFFRGNTVQWRREDLRDYPASLWTLKYALRGASKQDITAAADGDKFLVTIPAASSANFTPGDYWYQAYVEKGSGQNLERQIIGEGTLKVKAQLSAVTDPTYDNRSHVKKVLDALEAVIEGRATRADLEYTINGKTVKYMSPVDLRKNWTFYKRLYRSEQNAERVKKGLGTGNKILTRFVG